MRSSGAGAAPAPSVYTFARLNFEVRRRRTKVSALTILVR